MPNIIMADPKGGQTYEIVALPSAITNGANLATVVNGMGLTGPAIMVTTKAKSGLPNAYFTFASLNNVGNVSYAFRWDAAINNNVHKDLSTTFDYKAYAGDTYMIIPCPHP